MPSSLSVSPGHVDVAATTTDTAPPTAVITGTVSNPPGAGLYAGANSTPNGIVKVDFIPRSRTTADFNIEFKAPGGLQPGTYNDTVTIHVCYDAYCDREVDNSPQVVGVQYVVTPGQYPVPTLSTLSPNSAGPGTGAFTISASGSGFFGSSVLQWNGSARPTTYVSSSQLTAQITAADVANSGTAEVTVANPAPGGGTSNAVSFAIQSITPAITRVAPASAPAGSPAFTLTVLGNNFDATSTLNWNGTARQTTYVSPSEITAQVAAADVASVGTATVSVVNQGGTSAGSSFAIAPTSQDAVAFQINASHTGAVSFDAVSFPSNSAWTRDIGGTPSYALIAEGKVIVTVNTSSGYRLIALDQRSGGIAWGPIALSGPAWAVYDAGSLFVLSQQSGSGANPAILQSLDPSTGHLTWSTTLTGQYSFGAAPTAADGFVYVIGAGTGATLYSVDEQTGAIAWTQPVEGTGSTPAVTLDGVYVDYTCQAYDFRPATGELIWTSTPTCTGGGTATAVVADGALYFPDETYGRGGHMLDTASGATLGPFAANQPSAIADSRRYSLQDGTLRGIALDSNQVLWSFAGDGSLATAPIAVNQYVIVGASSGALYALDGATGKQVWTTNVGTAIPSGPGLLGTPFTGLSAGDGLLVVPAGHSVIAYALVAAPGQPSPLPVLSSLNPSATSPGSPAFTLTATGSNFVPSSQVLWNGSPRATTYVSATQLTAQITQADCANGGSASVAVSNPSPGGGSSNAVAFAIQSSMPTVGQLLPGHVAAGGTGFTLTVMGTNFDPSSVLNWNGSSRPTTFVSATQLTAQIADADIAGAGTATVTVSNPAPGGASNPATLTITATSTDAVAFQINPAHTGVVNFGAISFPLGSTWVANVGGTPSYALIADSRVFVTVSLSTGKSALLALDEATGKVLWGPTPLNGVAGAAYDAGRIFVVSYPFANPGLVQAFDAVSGAFEWSASLAPQWTVSSSLTAMNGIVYASAAGGGGTIYALDESTGALVWTQSVENGDSSTPAVTSDGVYVAYPYNTYDLNPLTGGKTWYDRPGGDGGGGGTCVVANGRLYAPNGFATYNGQILDAETGGVLGSYIADNAPAVATQTGYFLQSGTLRGISLNSNATIWSFAGDGSLVTSPIGVNQYAIIGSSNGNLYALDGATGVPAWTVNVGAAIPSGPGWGAQLPLSGLSAGDGLLVVPAGPTLVAYRLANN